MKFISFEWEGKEQYGVVYDEKKILNLSQIRLKESSFPEGLLEGIRQGEEFTGRVEQVLAKPEAALAAFFVPMQEIRFLPPIPHPPKNIICVGKNYRDHAIEMGSAKDIPEHVIVFTKATTTVNAHLVPIDSHRDATKELDYEGELAVIIGKKGSRIDKKDALSHVFGYTILNDVTARDLQRIHKQYFIGKSLDGSCPIGPWIVHHSKIKNPNQLDITTKVNGEVRQHSNTENFIFPIEEIISELSKGMTLEPGDIIATGTPAGVGNGFNPPRFLVPGDEVEITIEGIGTLYNKVK
ncbi:fumarylacetoacetate hydrolase family protein [Heyndrickxia acidiproducens]|uniref:fumarylacetoacetate hydrolase family protein n=1 Tax=Heyndrickxia acidiproducens TaxID=1121084 RepID=UPI0003631C32|nr:fumarylacetoacetate hydrolase family protein [Heyndrickxia acidiproducens]